MRSTVPSSVYYVEMETDSSHVSHAHTSLPSVATVAEAEGHHPDLHLVSYNQVTAQLTTHAAGGLTENDFIMAVRRFCEGGGGRKGGIGCCYSGEGAPGNKKLTAIIFICMTTWLLRKCAPRHTKTKAHLTQAKIDKVDLSDVLSRRKAKTAA